LYYVTQLSKGSFPNTKFVNMSTQENENIIKSLNGKNSLRYDEISTLQLKCSVAFISSPINYISILVLLT